MIAKIKASGIFDTNLLQKYSIFFLSQGLESYDHVGTSVLTRDMLGGSGRPGTSHTFNTTNIPCPCRKPGHSQPLWQEWREGVETGERPGDSTGKKRYSLREEWGKNKLEVLFHPVSTDLHLRPRAVWQIEALGNLKLGASLFSEEISVLFDPHKFTTGNNGLWGSIIIQFWSIQCQ